MALDLLFQQALREVVEEIKGYSKEEFELKLADSKKSSFALTIDSLMGFQSESSMCLEKLIIPTTHNLLALFKEHFSSVDFYYSQFELAANDDQYLLAA